MSQGKLSREEAIHVQACVDDMFKALSKNKAREFLGALNDVCLFLDACKRTMPSEATRDDE